MPAAEPLIPENGLYTKSPDFDIVLRFTSVSWCGYALYKEHTNRSYIL